MESTREAQLKIEIGRALMIADFVTCFRELPQFARMHEDDRDAAIINFIFTLQPLVDQLAEIIESYGKIELENN